MERHVLQWHITHRCNLRCAHCYQEDFQAETDEGSMWEALDKYERFLRGRDLTGQVNLTGGEPLTHPAFWKLAADIRRRGMRLGVLTNGTLIDAGAAARLKALGPAFVQVSLDGARDTHDAIRGAGAFDGALAGIDRLKAEGVEVLISFTAQKGNWRDFAELSRVCRAHRVDKLWWDRVVSGDVERLALSTDEFRRLCASAGRRRRRYRRADGSSFVSCGRALQFLGTGRACRYRCGAGGNLLILLADGALMPCRRLPFTFGPIQRGELEELIDRSESMRALAQAPIPADCARCPHAFLCRGGAKCVTYAQTGRWDARDVNCWLRF